MFELLEPPREEVPDVPADQPPFDPQQCPVAELADWPGPDDDEDDPDGCDVLLVPGLAGTALGEFEQTLEADRLDRLDADATLAEAAASKHAERRVQARQLVLAGRWADLHGVLRHPTATGPGRERLIQLGGDGTPQIAEFAPAEFGAVLGTSAHAAAGLIGDALDLRHRFPLLWQSVQAGLVAVWMARKTVQQARPLSREAAARVDTRIAAHAATLTWGRLSKLVQQAILAADPPRAQSETERAAEEAGAFLQPDTDHGYATMIIKAAAGDLHALDKALDLLSRAQKILGDTRGPDQRRATAAGIIANPKAAQDLLDRAETARQTQRDAAAARRAAHPQPTQPIETQPIETQPIETDLPAEPTAPTSRQPFAFNTAVLYYHLSKQTLDAILAGAPFAGTSVVRVEDIGPVIADQVRRWLQHSHVTLKPVINLPGIQPVDHYETSPAISETIGLARQADYWIHASSLSRQQDNDHTTPYQPMDKGGPPGQTDPKKMGKMTRLHHRIKTHAGWTTTQPRPGTWLIRSPHGYHYLSDQHGTTPLGRL